MWVLIGLLAAFLLFVQCIASVGGDEDAVPQPVRTIAPLITPAAE
jgi:hypothetical protein